MSTAKYNFYWVFVALFAVSLFYPFKAIAQDGPSTLTQFTTIDCPTIDVSGKDLYEKDCVQDILNQLHQSYNKEMISAEDAIRKDKEITSAEDAPRADGAKQTSELYNKCEEDRVRASDMLSSCTASRDQAKVSLQAMEAQMQELIASRDQAKVSLEEKEAQIQELTASRDQANVSQAENEALVQAIRASHAQAIVALEANEAQIQELTTSRDQANEALQASQAHNLVLNETRRCTESAFERERRQETGPQISIPRGSEMGRRLCLDQYRFRELFCREE